MNRNSCGREDQTSTAARSGTIDRETALHAQECAVCSEIMLVGKFLNDNAVFADRERLPLPDPTLIWQRARLETDQQAAHLALRPIRIMKVIACAAFACSPWLRLLLPIGRELTASWSRSIDLNVASASKLWPTLANESTILLGAFGTLILLGLSSWYMLRQE